MLVFSETSTTMWNLNFARGIQGFLACGMVTKRRVTNCMFFRIIDGRQLNGSSTGAQTEVRVD
ncbi:hypothetical protein E1B28_010791 [Marasmius oreades]|uniref:Uncharacterized protein n=1 Tax=Marasmius oreades TaxID=181124 RepID=A0A9P7RSY9_9AGAR|nr:uncharacterized protein E1B28_010791 [Marasmius oreades]KAG7089082.1 hypothetical protein E1B28_010791 [Marasmius oreades]